MLNKLKNRIVAADEDDLFDVAIANGFQVIWDDKRVRDSGLLVGNRAWVNQVLDGLKDKGIDAHIVNSTTIQFYIK